MLMALSAYLFPRRTMKALFVINFVAGAATGCIVSWGFFAAFTYFSK